MHKIVVISDIELVSQLYITNLEVYLNSEVVLVDNYEKIHNLILEHPEIDLIISLSMIDDKNVIDELKKIFLQKEVIIPIISVGDSKSSNSDYDVKSYYSIQNIVRSAAKILGVNAKDMSAAVVENYYKISLKFIEKIKETPVNIYIQLMKNNKEEYHLLVSKGVNANQSIQKLLAEGIEDIYVQSIDRLKMINFVSIFLCNNLIDSKNKSSDEKQLAIENSMNFVAASIVSNDISPEILTLVNSCTKVMTEVVTEVPSLKNLLKSVLNNKNGYIYTHSMLSAYVAAHIVKSVPWGGATHIDKINFVLFFHDITLGPIYEKYPEFKMEEDLLFSGSLTEEEKELVLNHARLSAELVSGLKKCPIGADLLIKQHHGVGNGVGFAAEFRDDISPLSKIIIVSEAFIEELFLKRNEGESVVVSEIIKELKERFSKHTYKKIIETLNTLKI